MIIAFALAMAELLTLSFLFLGFAMGMLGVALFQFSFGGYDFNRDALVFVVVSLVSFVVFRRVFKTKSDQKFWGEDDINRY